MIREKKSSRPFPKVGDFVLIGHGVWSEPDQWWISECEWSDGQQFLVRHTMGWHPSHEPYLGAAEALIAVGTEEHCREIARTARDIRFRYIDDYRTANVALQAVRDRIISEIIDAVAQAGGIEASGRVA